MFYRSGNLSDCTEKQQSVDFPPGRLLHFYKLNFPADGALFPICRLQRQLKSIRGKIVRFLRLKDRRKSVAMTESKRGATLRTVGRSDYNGDVLSGSVNDDLDLNRNKSRNNLLSNTNSNNLKVQEKLVPVTSTNVTL